MSTLAAPGQDTLWDLPAPAIPAQAAPAPLKKTQRFHRPDLPAPLRGVCNPRCLVCGRDENTGLCAPCSIVCARPLTSVPVEVCLITRRVTAHPAGNRLTTVTCPWCSRTHWHSNTPTTPYRISGCGQPYVVTPAAEQASRIHESAQPPPGAPEAATTARGTAVARAALTEAAP